MYPFVLKLYLKQEEMLIFLNPTIPFVYFLHIFSAT